jgi:hypothetical protein
VGTEAAPLTDGTCRCVPSEQGTSAADARFDRAVFGEVIIIAPRFPRGAEHAAAHDRGMAPRVGVDHGVVSPGSDQRCGCEENLPYKVGSKD